MSYHTQVSQWVGGWVNVPKLREQTHILAHLNSSTEQMEGREGATFAIAA